MKMYIRTVMAGLILISNLLLVEASALVATTSPSTQFAPTNPKIVNIPVLSRKEGRVYTFTIPSNASWLRVTTTASSGDIDIYLRKSLVPSQKKYTWKSNGDYADESIFATKPAAGLYYLYLYPFTRASNVLLAMQYGFGTTTPPVIATSTVSVPAPTTGTICATDVYVCPSGASVGRSGVNCTFTCSSAQASSGASSPSVPTPTPSPVYSGGGGGGGSVSYVPTPAPAPTTPSPVVIPPTTPSPTVTVSASQTSIAYNATTNITWSSTNATTCTLSSGQSGTSGSFTTPSLTTNTTYTVSCTGAGGSVSGSVTVTVAAAPTPTVSISSSPASVTSGQTATVSWSSVNATTCTLSNGKTGVSGSFVTPALTTTTTYTISCTGVGGSISGGSTVTVAQPIPPANVIPTASITTPVSTVSVTQGASVQFTGSAVDTDGTISAYEWRDGSCTAGTLLSSASSFTSTTLSVGSHTVYFRAQDNSGAWSTTCPSRIVTVSAPVVQTPTTVSTTFTLSTVDFPNPERGFYGWSGDDFVASYDAGSVAYTYSLGQRLVLAKIQLDAYRTTDLPATYLTSLNAQFAKIRSAGMKATVLFNYDFSGTGKDATAAQIKRHLEQLQPILAANADVIPFMRAGFIGAWGEWHSSASGNTCGYNSGTTSCTTADANKVIVRDALFANVPASTQIAFRYPVDIMKWYPSPTQQTRAGFHNDCFLAGPDDSGTYQSTAQRVYVQSLTAGAASGGENCSNTGTVLRTAGSDILTEGAQYHLTWLNGSDWSGFMTAWKNAGVYDQVSRSIGYRFQLDSASHVDSVTKGSAVTVTVAMHNIGWSKLFSARPLVVTLKNKVTGDMFTGSAGDLRNLPPQSSSPTSIPVTVAVPTTAIAGDYDVYLSVPDIYATTKDNPVFAIRFANADDTARSQAWNAATALFKVGTTVKVQ